MIFEIDFNREDDDTTLEQIGAKLEKYEDYNTYKIEINNFEKLEELLRQVDQIKKDYFSAVISFDPPTIYLDNKA